MEQGLDVAQDISCDSVAENLLVAAGAEDVALLVSHARRELGQTQHDHPLGFEGGFQEEPHFGAAGQARLQIQGLRDLAAATPFVAAAFKPEGDKQVRQAFVDGGAERGRIDFRRFARRLRLLLPVCVDLAEVRGHEQIAKVDLGELHRAFE